MSFIGVQELLIIFGIIILLFGARKIPEIGRGLGKGIMNFKRAIKGESDKQDETEKQDKEEEKKPAEIEH